FGTAICAIFAIYMLCQKTPNARWRTSPTNITVAPSFAPLVRPQFLPLRVYLRRRTPISPWPNGQLLALVTLQLNHGSTCKPCHSLSPSWHVRVCVARSSPIRRLVASLLLTATTRSIVLVRHGNTDKHHPIVFATGCLIFASQPSGS